MTNEVARQPEEDRPRSTFERFVPFLALTFAGNAVGAAMLVTTLGLALDVPLRSLLAPYAVLVDCSLVLGPLMYWARLARRRPQSYARRFAIAIFAYTHVLSWAIGFAMVRLRVYSQAEAIVTFAWVSLIH